MKTLDGRGVMQKYKGIYFRFITASIRKPLYRRFGKADGRKIIKQARACNRELLRRAEDIGANNPMAPNLYFAIALISYHVGTPELIGKDEMKFIIDALFSNKLLIKVLSRKDFNRPKDFQAFKDNIRRMSDWIEARKDLYPSSWNFDFETDHDKGFYYGLSPCPIAKFFREQDLEEYTPLMCEIDYRNFGFFKARLFREHTIAEGAPFCDFWIVPNDVDLGSRPNANK